MTIAIKPAGLIRFDDTGLLWLNFNEAVEYDFIKIDVNDWHITKEQCDKNVVLVKFSTKSVDLIYDSFENKK